MKGKERKKGKEGKGREGKGREGKERKGKKRKGKERKGKERKGKERKGKEKEGKKRKKKKRKKKKSLQKMRSLMSYSRSLRTKRSHRITQIKTKKMMKKSALMFNPHVTISIDIIEEMSCEKAIYCLFG